MFEMMYQHACVGLQAPSFTLPCNTERIACQWALHMVKKLQGHEGCHIIEYTYTMIYLWILLHRNDYTIEKDAQDF